MAWPQKPLQHCTSRDRKALPPASLFLPSQASHLGGEARGPPATWEALATGDVHPYLWVPSRAGPTHSL